MERAVELSPQLSAWLSMFLSGALTFHTHADLRTEYDDLLVSLIAAGCLSQYASQVEDAYLKYLSSKEN